MYEVNYSKDFSDLKAEISSINTEIENLKCWQDKQNGSLQKLEEKVDRLQWYLTTLLGGLAVSLFLQIINLLKK